MQVLNQRNVAVGATQIVNLLNVGGGLRLRLRLLSTAALLLLGGLGRGALSAGALSGRRLSRAPSPSRPLPTRPVEVDAAARSHFVFPFLKYSA